MTLQLYEPHPSRHNVLRLALDEDLAAVERHAGLPSASSGLPLCLEEAWAAVRHVEQRPDVEGRVGTEVLDEARLIEAVGDVPVEGKG